MSSALLQLVRAHAALATRRLHQLGLVPPQELVLLHLDESGPVAQRELVAYLGRDRSTVTATVQAMERGGLVTRHPSAGDRRALVVALTDHGAELCAPVRALWRELEDVTFGHLDNCGRAQLGETLGRARDRVASISEQPSTRTQR